MATIADPIATLPEPRDVNAYIGHLLRELRVARQLYKLTTRARETLPGRPQIFIPHSIQAARGGPRRG